MSETGSRGPGQVFADFLGLGEVRLQVCRGCGRQIFYPRVLCPGCGGRDLNWQPISGKGTVYSTTTVRQRPERGGDYNVAIVELAEGARLMSRIEGIDPSAVRIGMQVAAAIADSDEGPLLVFRPAEAAAD